MWLITIFLQKKFQDIIDASLGPYGSRVILNLADSIFYKGILDAQHLEWNWAGEDSVTVVSNPHLHSR